MPVRPSSLSFVQIAVSDSSTQVLAVGDTVRHLEVHDDLLYYSVDRDGIYRRPLAGGAAELVHAYPMNLEHEGEFTLDGDDLYFAEPPHMMFMTLTDRHPRIIVEDLGEHNVIVALDGFACLSALVMPGTTRDLRHVLWRHRAGHAAVRALVAAPRAGAVVPLDGIDERIVDLRRRRHEHVRLA